MTWIRSYFIIFALTLLLQLADSTEPVLKVVKPHNKVNDTKECKNEDCQQSTTVLPEPSLSQTTDSHKPHERRLVPGLNFPSPVSFHFEFPNAKGKRPQDDKSKASFLEQRDQDGMREGLEADPDDSQSFLMGPAEQINSAVAKIVPFCCEGWLEFEKKSDGTYNTAIGSFGVGVFGLLHNDGKHGIKVYRNSEMTSSTGSLRDINFDPKKLKPTSKKPIPVMVKVLKPATDETNSLGFFPETTALDKEVRRARLATKFELRKGEPIFPDIYDIQTTSGEAHPIHEVAYIQERIDGSSAYTVLFSYVEEEKQSMKLYLTLLLEQFTHWLLAVGAEKRAKAGMSKEQKLGNLQGVTAALLRGVDQKHLKRKTAKELHKIFKKTAEQATKEIWLRAGPRLSLTSYVYNFAFKTWKHMLHCDGHWGNVFLDRELIHSKAALKKAKTDRKAVFSNVFVRLSDTAISQEEQNALKDGIPVYRLQPKRIKWIDPADALPLDPIFDEIRKETGGINPEDQLFSPCAIYRDLAPADLVELQRVGSTLALGSYNSNPRVQYEQATLNLPSTVAAIFKTYSDSLHHYQTKQFDQSPLGNSEADQPYREAWMELYSTMEAFDVELDKLSSVFTSMTRALDALPEKQGCIEALRSAMESREIRSVARSPKPWMGAQKLVGEKCSVGQMKKGAKSLQKIIKEGAGHFPQYAVPETFDT